MIANQKTTGRIDRKVLLSALWIVVMINMLKADILSLYIPGVFDEMAKFVGDTPIPLVMLGAAIMMEISIVMIFLSRVLTYRVNRWANIIVSLVTIVWVVGPELSGDGWPYPHYIFIATVEVLCLLLIVWYAWQWTKEEA